jgi:hypothetical protein
MPRTTERVGLLLSVALMSACGGGVSTDHGASMFVDSQAPGSACAAFTQALCGYLVQCRGAPYCSAAHCLADNDCAGFSSLSQALRAGAVAYDEAAGSACLARFSADPCGFGALPQSFDVFDVLSQCPGALTPRSQQSAACVSSSECVAGFVCTATSSGCAGVCVPHATASVGAPCTSYADCESGGPSLWCDATTTTCAAGVAAGAACGATSGGVIACATGLWCDALASGVAGVCRASGGAGAPCNDLGGCETSPPLALHCAGYAPSGADAGLGSCAAPAGADGGCELNSDCAAGLVCVSGTCGAPLDVGLRCRSDDYCRKGLTCATEKCLEAKCPGDDCTDPNSACVLSVCKAGVCQLRARAGASCADGADCTSGTCTDGACAAVSACPP